jgi:Spy/CpxP family protein refolding chaperone
MKTYVIGLVLLLGTLSASAQIERKSTLSKNDTAKAVVSNSAEDTKKAKKREMMKDLNLTREQQGKMKEIMKSGKAAKDAIQNNEQLSDQEKKQQLRELKKTQAQKVQAILTPEQLEKFKANRESDN